jgi:hypothetical protein
MENDVQSSVLRNRETAFRIVGHQRMMTLDAQKQSKRICRVSIIVDDQDFL